MLNMSFFATFGVVLFTVTFLFFPKKAYADVFPERRVIHLTREAVIDRYRFPLFFQCVGPDRMVKSISVSNVSSNGASIMWSQHVDAYGGGLFLEIIPTRGGGSVRMTVTARGDSGRSYKTMVEIIVD